MNFTKIQAEHREWSAKNFPDQKAHHCLLGMIEEVGELAHAQLKLEQGIRVNEDHIEARKDAIADIALYLIGYCNYCNVELTLPKRELENVYVNNKDITQSIFHLTLGVFNITEEFDKYDCAKYIIQVLECICDNIKIGFEQNLLDTWKQVKQRDWTKNKNNGIVSAEGNVIV